MKKIPGIRLNIIFAVVITCQAVDTPEVPPSLSRQYAAAQEKPPSLYQNYTGLFPIGAAADSVSYRTHADLLKKHFNGIVCENEMKFECLQNTEGVFDYTKADSIVDFAATNHMTIRGHCLVWHRQTPGWVFTFDSNLTDAGKKEVLLARMKKHITNVVSHFKGKVYAWDVVNEAITGNTNTGDDAGEDLSKVVSFDYRSSPWYRICGPDYIAEAYKCAHKADPGAKLFYNDFFNYIPGKRQAIYTLVKGLLEKGVPVHGIGLQCHLNIRPSPNANNQAWYQSVENLEKAIRLYSGLGVELQVTEMDVSVYTRGEYTSSDRTKWYTTEADVTDEVKNRQAARYKEFFDLFREYKKVITGVTLWGIADDNTWMSEFASKRPDYPLLFDKGHQPKKAFESVINKADRRLRP